MSQRWGRRQFALVLTLSAAILAPAASAAAEPISVAGSADISSHGGDFPQFEGEPLLELLFYFSGFRPGQGALDALSGEVHETSGIHGTLGGLQVNRAAAGRPLGPGEAFDVSAQATWTNGTYVEYFLQPEGVTFTSYLSEGDFRFHGVTAILEPWGDSMLIATAPFTFTGLLGAFDSSRALQFRREFIGRGLAQVFLARDGSRFTYHYELQPIPEPATMLLLGGGLGVLAVGRRSLRRRPSRP